MEESRGEEWKEEKRGKEGEEGIDNCFVAVLKHISIFVAKSWLHTVVYLPVCCNHEYG